MCIRDRYKDNIKLWSRYVDDVLVIWEGSIEEVHEMCIRDRNYLDLNIEIKDNEKLQFGIFRKES